ncbi:MAG: SulP family inorganic anion transporter [Paludibacteraceae bacterium]|nr:SulP family inorganic anion transporter [Paludibacteraceae bacterium]
MKFSVKSAFAPKIVETMRHYGAQQLTQDTLAGIIVGIVAIPLAIAFGIASGVGPTEGLITAVIAGFFISLLGGSKVQIGGPTGAFIVIVYGIIQQFGLAGLMIATVMAGVLLVAMGFARLGSVIKFVPYPVTIGFTAGIALTIFSTQMNDFFGLGLTNIPANFIDKWIFYAHHATEVNLWTLGIGAFSLLICIFLPKLTKKIPSSLAAIVLATLAVWLLKTFMPESGAASIVTISDLYELPHGIPAPRLPELTLSENETIFTLIQKLFPSAFTIAILCAIESLLSAMVADGVIGDKHNSNTELIAQGVANIVVPFFGGIPATGAIARTMTNINNGGRTPIAGIVHVVILLLVLLFMGGLVGLIPMSCLAAVLIMVAYNMSGWRTIAGMLKHPTRDVWVLAITFFLTVIFDLTVAIEVGILGALVLFLMRTSEATQIRTFNGEIDPNEDSDVSLNLEHLTIPEGVEVYEIDGPYFFGIANRFDDEMNRVAGAYKVRIIRMRKVPFVDSTAMHNLSILIERSHEEGTTIILSGVREHVRHQLMKQGIDKLINTDNICENINLALERANVLLNA